MLARKGYPPGLVFRLIREAMQQEGAELDELDADAYLDPDPDAGDPATGNLATGNLATGNLATGNLATGDSGPGDDGGL